MNRTAFLRSLTVSTGGFFAATMLPGILTFIGSSVATGVSAARRLAGKVLEYLRIVPSAKSVDYVTNKKQFHLYNLLTEQRHPKTMELSSVIAGDTRKGLEMILSVDEDITGMIGKLTTDLSVAEQAVDAMVRAIRSNRRIYFYGCGATGRLAKQFELLFNCLAIYFEDNFIGEMTGADRALISSLEGFEDLQIIGRLQLADRGIQKGDAVFCVTEGGETSSVIGTMLAAVAQYGEMSDTVAAEARRNLFFVYNNPDELLMPFDRSRSVLENPAVTKLNLATGPQAITGSTRMQATTSETFVLGAILEEALYRVLKEKLSQEKLTAQGFPAGVRLGDRLRSFGRVQQAVYGAAEQLSRLTDLEAETYRSGRYSTYFASKGLMTVFIDSTERSPTFRLYPLDTVDQKERRSWIQVWTDATSQDEAWRKFLGRDFRGMESDFYRPAFATEVDDPYLREAALRSLTKAGNDQKWLYDLSLSESNLRTRGPEPGDIGIILCIDNEYDRLNKSDDLFHRFRSLFREKGAQTAVIRIVGEKESRQLGIERDLTEVTVVLPDFPDPLGLRRQVAAKMLLNAHSTAVMAKLGKVTGNTMTNVNPGNLKLIGRATYLAMLHVNDAISRPEWVEKYGYTEPVTFEEVNAVLYEAIDYVAAHAPGQTAEVALTIARMVEALRVRGYVGW